MHGFSWSKFFVDVELTFVWDFPAPRDWDWLTWILGEVFEANQKFDSPVLGSTTAYVNITSTCP
jgi:hypothetical protein